MGAAEEAATGEPALHAVAVVVPVYRGERTLEALFAELEALSAPHSTPAGHRLRVSEILFVHDGAVDDSASVMQSLARKNPPGPGLWLARNFCHRPPRPPPAPLAGMASTSADWVATLDEDGQQDPRDIGKLLERRWPTGPSSC